jgi:carbon storage regulator CsrA
MLILTLTEGESVHINDDIKVIFNDVKTSHVKVAVYAPRDVKISRGITHVGDQDEDLASNF